MSANRAARLLSGLGVGLATASKQTGVLACIPVIAATVLSPERRRAWLYLATAGLTSVAVFAVLNPFPEGIAKFLWQREMYLGWAEQAAVENPRPPTPLFVLELVLRPDWHGRWIGAASLLGLVGLLVIVVRHRGRSPVVRRQLAM